MYFDAFSDLDRLAARLTDTVRGPRFMPIDLYREGDHYILNADLPGVDPGSVDIDVDGQLLTVRAERTPRSDGNTKWLANERPSGSFLRQFNLGDGIASDQISANYNNGVLSVMIPVSEKAVPRKIQISSSGGGEQAIRAGASAQTPQSSQAPQAAQAPQSAQLSQSAQVGSGDTQ